MELRLGGSTVAAVILAAVLGTSSGSQVTQLTFGKGTEAYPVVSPDGQWLAFERLQGEDPDGTEIWVMSIEAGFHSAHRVTPKGQFSSGPSWSSDSHWIGFAGSKTVTRGDYKLLTYQLYKTNIDSGEVIQLTRAADNAYDAGIGIHPVWSSNGWIAFDKDGDIYGIKENGGPIVRLLKVRSAGLQTGHLEFLAWSPDSTRIAFDLQDYPASRRERASSSAVVESNTIWIGDIASGSIRQVLPGPWDKAPQWIDNESLVFVRGSRADRKFNIYALLLTSGKIMRLTSGYIDWLPHVTPDGSSLVFSRLKNIPRGHGFNFLFGSHIFRMMMPANVSTKAPVR